MPQRLGVFVSSPEDVPDELLRADLVIDKLSQDNSRFSHRELSVGARVDAESSPSPDTGLRASQSARNQPVGLFASHL
jgi:hypothetical protein